MIRTICVYCGSAEALHEEYFSAAREMGALLAGRGLRVVYGAGRTGLMGALADGALGAGGEVIGVIPAIFNTPKLAHHRLTRLEVVENMHQRKHRMAELADAFVALPGGYGTFEELFEMLTWAQIGIHRKPIGLFNIREYFSPLLAVIEHAHNEGFIYAEHRNLFTAHHEAAHLLDALLQHRHPGGVERWLERP